MTHPFQPIVDSKYAWVFWPLAALTILLMIVLGAIPLTPDIIQFELAGSVTRANSILTAWKSSEQTAWAAFSLGLDFLYIVAYSNTIGFACVWATKAIQERGDALVSVGIWLAWGQWLAALLDVLEDIALLIILFSSVTAPWPQIAMWCAIFKFSLVILGLLYVGIGGVVKFLKPKNKQA